MSNVVQKSLLLQEIFLFLLLTIVSSTVGPPEDLVVEISDDDWDRIQKGQWIVGFFDTETKESQQLENDWTTFALKCKEQNINVGKVLSVQNPGLDVRFLVTTFPSVFYIKNGVAHPIPKVNRETMMNIIRNKGWSKLKPVNFLSNPFSVQMSLLSHLFIHAVNLYNYEDAIVQKIIPFASATDIAFGLTFIVIGTLLGLLLTALIGFISIFFFETKEDIPQEELDESEEEEKDDDKQGETSPKESNAVRKRK